ncbi:hypothetical protein CK203_067014 [Vitis vinifera]|uniref:Reverse transcriptase zinc-binding domain-containing protein n=1 Tax=Vitis vinifera TaxID=29760 RepID=A0A438F5I4_VITVI|nr:hypothetical protein CK203_067014 [Vitis vinifera]
MGYTCIFKFVFVLMCAYCTYSAGSTFLTSVQVLWESQLEYYICRNDWVEVSKLLDVIPSSLLSYGSLQISLDSLQSASTVGCNREFPDYGNYICSIEELDTVCIDIPAIKIFRHSANNICSIWLRMFMEQELAKKFIFLKDYWEGTAEIIPLLARSNFITSRTKIPMQDKYIESSSDLNISNIDGALHADTVQALHKLVIHHCAQYNLPNLLDIYLDHHKLALDNESLLSLQEAAVSFLHIQHGYLLGFPGGSVGESLMEGSYPSYLEGDLDSLDVCYQGIMRWVSNNVLKIGPDQQLDWFNHQPIAFPVWFAFSDHPEIKLVNRLIQQGDCHWAKWLLLSRIKGREYDASFLNARSIMSRNSVPSNNLNVLEIEEIIRIVDDIAEGGGEMAALATLMYAPVPIQNCLSSGSVNRHYSSSAQCTLENLRPTLQRFPTLWRTLVAASFGHDATSNFLSPKAKNDYLSWRDNIFFSTAHDTSLLQMLPCWFSKAIRRLIQLYVQGPLGWQSLESFPPRDVDLFVNSNDHADISAISWEAAIQKHVEEELYASSLRVVESGLGLEQHLHRGRALAAFNHLLGVRVQKLKLENTKGQSSASVNGQTNVQSDVQMLLSPITQSEESLLSSVRIGSDAPEIEVVIGLVVAVTKGNGHGGLCDVLSIITIWNPWLLSTSSFFMWEASWGKVLTLEQHQTRGWSLACKCFLCKVEEKSIDHILLQCSKTRVLWQLLFALFGVIGSNPPWLKRLLYLGMNPLWASMLRIDIAALRRISSFYKSSEYTEHYRQLSPKGSALHAVSHEVDITNSLAQALADDYVGHDGSSIVKQKGTPNSVTSKRPSRALMLVLQHLEKVSTKSCKSALESSYSFCQMHQIPLSTKYLGLLARDNDWVGFLSEAQVGGYPFEKVIQVASREFSDPRLKIHIVTVLKGLLSRKKVSSSSNLDTSEKRNETSFVDENSFIPVELFGILAECEKGKNPGEALLVKAKELCWSILAMIASCFPDVSPLSCLTVWLEITAARETSSIKVNDIASKIANSVGAAVEATNSLPVGGRPLQFHYNRRNPKRRRLMEPISLEHLAATTSDVSCVSDSAKIFSVQGFVAEVERKSDAGELTKVSVNSDDGPNSLSKMVAVLCEQRLFLPLLRAFEMFLPSCSLLPFIRALQAFSQMRLSEASAHLGSFSARIKEEPIIGREGQIGTSWISSTAVKAADAMLSTCPSPYEKRCLLQLLAATDFGDGGSAATYYRRLYWKINLAEPSLRKDDGLHLGNETLDDSSLLTALEKNGHWEQARNWARQLEASGGPWKSAVHHVTETQDCFP